jgi:hypothetical protein
MTARLNKLECFVPAMPRFMFNYQARSLPKSGALYTLSGLACKFKTRLKRIVKENTLAYFDKIIIDPEKNSFLIIGTWKDLAWLQT